MGGVGRMREREREREGEREYRRPTVTNTLREAIIKTTKTPAIPK